MEQQEQGVFSYLKHTTLHKHNKLCEMIMFRTMAIRQGGALIPERLETNKVSPMTAPCLLPTPLADCATEVGVGYPWWDLELPLNGGTELEARKRPSG